MAREKIGLNYYWVETDRYLDPKIKRLKRRFKAAGLGVYDYILSEIYRVRGCYLEWNEEVCFDVAEYFEMEESEVNDIVSLCLSVGLFSQNKFEETGKLTSKSIQKRFTDISKKAKRHPQIPEELIICQEESNLSREKSAILPEKTAQIPQVRKGKVSIGKVSNRAKALLASTEAEQNQNDLKKKYDALLVEVESMESKEVWVTIKNFIATHKPLFPEPYADLWNIFAVRTRLSKVEKLPESRIKKFNARIRDPAFDFIRILESIKKSPLLRGDTGDWKVYFDWIIENDKNYLKIIEGAYN